MFLSLQNMAELRLETNIFQQHLYKKNKYINLELQALKKGFLE